MDYGNLSDFELSCYVVAKKMNLLSRWKPIWFSEEHDIFIAQEREGEGRSRRVEITFNINSWTDMGPVISDNSISITPSFEDDSIRPKASHWIAQKQSQNITEKDKSPLRAAAICYLEMDN